MNLSKLKKSNSHRITKHGFLHLLNLLFLLSNLVLIILIDISLKVYLNLIYFYLTYYGLFQNQVGDIVQDD
jgi:hypothetical protein